MTKIVKLSWLSHSVQFFCHVLSTYPVQYHSFNHLLLRCLLLAWNNFVFMTSIRTYQCSSFICYSFCLIKKERTINKFLCVYFFLYHCFQKHFYDAITDKKRLPNTNTCYSNRPTNDNSKWTKRNMTACN